MTDFSDVTRDDVERATDFEGGKTGAVHILERLGFLIRCGVALTAR
jgi:hypothetical protein